jgi:hypothetical protein
VLGGLVVGLPYTTKFVAQICADYERYYTIRVDIMRILTSLKRKYARKAALAIIQDDNETTRKVLQSIVAIVHATFYGADQRQQQHEQETSISELDAMEANSRDQLRDIETLAAVYAKLLNNKQPLLEPLEQSAHIFAPPPPPPLSSKDQVLRPFPCLRSACENLHAEITGIIVPFNPADDAVCSERERERERECVCV